MGQITGAELFVKALKEEAVDTLFAYPGGQAVDLFDALYGERDIEVILPRHEQGLVHAADGYARSTGRVGVCLVTSGPGAANLVTGIATANYDSVPLVCFTGQVPTGLIGNDAFQEVDIVGITRSICKYAVTVRKREDLAEIIKRAFTIARTGKPGVVVVDLPKDIQKAYGSDFYPAEIKIRGYKPNTAVHMGQIGRAWEVLRAAERPVFLIGGGVHIAHAEKEMTQLAELTGVPVVTTIMGKGALPTSHGLYIGNIGIHGSYAANSAISNCDVLFSIGTRFNDRITGKIEEFARNAVIVHIDIDTASISRNISVDIPIVADAKKAIVALTEKAEPLHISKWTEKIHEWKKEYPIEMAKSGLTPQRIIEEVNDFFTDAVIATDVGQNQLWATQFLALDEHRQLLTSGGLGTMGYGLPAAIGAKLGNPGKDVIAISGDGGIQMNIQELATAVCYELPIIICILNNGYLGNVRQWQEMFYGRRYSSTCMRYRKSCEKDCSRPGGCCPEYTPDFIRLAESYGARGIRVTEEGDIRKAFESARQNTKGPTVIEFIIDRELNVLPMVPPGNPLDDMILSRDAADPDTGMPLLGGTGWTSAAARLIAPAPAEKKKRWIGLLVENEIGVLARISGLFSGKAYNLDSLAVGATEDSTVSRMTISLTSDDKTFEQIKKQLNRSAEVIKVVDYTDTPIHMKEILFVRVNSCSEGDVTELFRIAQIYGVDIIDYDGKTVLLECTQTEKRNNDLIHLLNKRFLNRIRIVRGGSVAAPAVRISD